MGCWKEDQRVITRSFSVHPFLNLRGLTVPRGLVLNENLNENRENKGGQ